ncbi:MAG: FkbM family methyltransferase [Bacteroidota bacterium]
MVSIGKTIKNYLYSKSAPNFLFSLYFNRLMSKNRKQLEGILGQGNDLIQHLSDQEKAHWVERINDVLQSPDNAAIPRAEKAGKLVDDQLIMHNGIKIDPLSYYSFPLLKMLIDNKGVHEPQEEKIFQEVCQSLPKDGKKTMLELGAYWSFYSMWFQQYFASANCYMVEPDRRNLFYGKRNVQLNRLKGTFIHAGIGRQMDRAHNITNVDTICAQQGIEFIDILHSDIQGYELEMLEGSEQTLKAGKVGYIFISTHSNDLHRDCHHFLKERYGFSLVASADLKETFSWDGILVMKAPDYPGVNQVSISKKQAQYG